MTPIDVLEQVAAQLAVRVRDDDPNANARWLASQLPDPADWWRLAFVLAAAIPDDRTWRQLTAWARPEDEQGRAVAAECGTPSGYRRHRKDDQEACTPCKAAERVRSRQRRALARAA